MAPFFPAVCWRSSRGLVMGVVSRVVAPCLLSLVLGPNQSNPTPSPHSILSRDFPHYSTKNRHKFSLVDVSLGRAGPGCRRGRGILCHRWGLCQGAGGSGFDLGIPSEARFFSQ